VGPIRESAFEIAEDSSGLLAEVRRSLLSVTERDRDVLVRRLGFETTSQTLQEIADALDVSRQRIQQIEARATKKWINESKLAEILQKRIAVLLDGRSFPLLLTGVEAIDPWFTGVSAHQQFLKNLVRKLPLDQIHIIEIDGLHFLGLIGQSVWERTFSEARVLLSSATSQQWNEANVRSLVHGLLPETASEFRPLLWEMASELCHFSASPDGSRTLVSYGRGAEPLVEAILTESESPLHFAKIAELATARCGRSIDLRRAHSAAAKVGLLFGRGTYGLKRHVPLSDNKILEICAEAEELLCSDGNAKQWHASEILIALSKRLGDKYENLDKYVLCIALANSTKLKSLRKMVWTTASEDTIGQTRIAIHQAVIAIVKEAGHPLSTSEIKERLTEERGVSEFFQIFPIDPLIRVQPGVWGISGRDVPV